VLPQDVLKDLVLSEHYHVEEFMEVLRSAPVSIVPGFSQQEPTINRGRRTDE
jgi:hypothetical protein